MSHDPARLIARSARQIDDPAERAAYLDRVCHGIVRLRADVERLLAEGIPDEPETRAAPVPAPPSTAATAATAAAPERTTAAAPTPRREAPTAPAVEEPETRAGAAAPAAEPSSEKAGDTIGRFRLVSELGQGGFGTVWLAEQFEPVRRQVALKIIKLGMDTVQVVARFEQERQALALMDHPHVARVIDAGATATGRPYFVMDLVRGQPILEYCDAARLPIRARLELFGQVCSAVQHAHTKGIIHRDLKPSNVLVGTREGRPHATVIDFGIAKATSARLTERSLVTEAYQVIGTLQYMSPEQSQASPDIDTRTDVYSLGVILYELLAGTTPYDAATFDRAMFAEILRMIHEQDPPPPSSRITASADLPRLAESRSIEAPRLARALRGELDWIVMKAIEKDRERRYETAEALAADLRRYLDGEPVLAAPPSAAYRLRKMVRRHRGAVAAAAAVAATLVAGVFAFAWQADVAEEERDAALGARAAEERQRRVADEQRDRALRAETEAKARAAELQLVADFQAGMLGQIDPAESGRALTADVAAKFEEALAGAGLADAEREAEAAAFRAQWTRVNATDAARELIDRTILRPAVETIDRKFPDQPLVDAQLRQAVADRYVSIGLYAEAAPLQERALATRRRVLGDDDPVTLRSFQASAALLVAAGRLAEAEAAARDVLERRRSALGAEHRETVESAELLGIALTYRGRWAEAEPILRDVVAWRVRTLGERDESAVSARVNHAGALRGLRRDDEAASCFEAGLAAARAGIGEDHHVTRNLLNNFATFEQHRGRTAEAEKLFRDLLAARRRTQGEEHPDTLVTLGNLAFVLHAAGRTEEGERLARESMEKRRRVLGPDHPITLYSVHDVGEMLASRGKFEEAAALVREAYEKRRATLGETHEATMMSRQVLTRILVQSGRPEEAERIFRETAERLRAELGPDDPATIVALHQLGGHLMGMRKHADAEVVLREVAERGPAVLGDVHPSLLDAEGGLAAVLFAQGKLDEGLDRVNRLIARAPRSESEDGRNVAPVLDVAIEHLINAERLTQAEPLAREEVRVRSEIEGPDARGTLRALNRLGVVLQRQNGREAEAEVVLRDAWERRLRAFGAEDPDTQVSVKNMTVVLGELGRLDDALPFLRSEVETARRRTGAASMETMEALSNLAGTLLLLDRLDEAEACGREVLAAARKTLGADHQGTLDALAFVGRVLHFRGRPVEAAEVLEELYPKVRRAMGPGSVGTLSIAVDLAVGLRAAGRGPQALKLLEDTVRRARAGGAETVAVLPIAGAELARSLLGEKGRDAAVAAANDLVADARRRQPAGSLALAQEIVTAAAVLLDAGDAAGAEPALREAEAIRARDAADAWSTFNARGLLGEAVLAQKRFAEAEPLVVAAYEGVVARRAQVPPQGRHWIGKCGARVLRLYAEWDAAEPGKGHDAKLAAWKARIEPGSAPPK